MERMRFLGTFGIIREAVRIGIRNPSFIPLATIVSLPLFCITLLHELLLQHILMEASLSPQLRKLPPNSNSLAVTRLTHMMSGRVLLLALLYLIPIQFLNLLTAVTTVYSASAIHAGARPLGLQDMLHNSIAKTRWKGPLVTYVYTFLLSNISSMVIVFFILLGPLLVSRNVLLLLVSMMGVMIALGIWLVLSAWWNMGVVISILEDKGGLEALSTSQYLSKAIGLVCVGKVIKWVVFMVYYHDCKWRCREKVDMEEVQGIYTEDMPVALRELNDNYPEAMIVQQQQNQFAIQVVEHQVKSSPSLDERLQPQREDFYMFQDPQSTEVKGLERRLLYVSRSTEHRGERLGDELHHIVHDQEMDFLDALKEALIVPYKNINIIIFCLFFFTSLTLFCFLS
ncbi:hypothetical protein CK203_016962 [Vitis vinifera]|uniref:Uncharacterized protein n=1 Tax=Vitis vinifera TaxID=29760 RepID=A0A438JNL2_VITVI|nr:hypothetical protein CK203_016962 [Vitis vinifera]